ncbi:unnamed protein product, partial [Allacma fusca]
VCFKIEDRGCIADDANLVGLTSVMVLLFSACLPLGIIIGKYLPNTIHGFNVGRSDIYVKMRSVLTTIDPDTYSTMDYVAATILYVFMTATLLMTTAGYSVLIA